MIRKTLPAFFQFGLILPFGALLLCFGCGGGSVGTGVSNDKRSFEGLTVSQNDVPLPGVSIVLLNTGESAKSGVDGRFLLFSDFHDPIANLQISTTGFSGSFSTPNIGTDSSGTRLKIILDDIKQSVSVSSLEVSVQVRGSCDYYFENSRIIRQANALADGTTCSLRVEIRSAGQPAEGVPFLLQHRRCLEGAPWHDAEVGETATSAAGTLGVGESGDSTAQSGDPKDGVEVSEPHPGVARLPFVFFNDEAHCVYRVLAPHLENIEPVIYEIQTFRKQDFDAKQNSRK